MKQSNGKERSFRERLRDHERLIGILLMQSAPAIAEMCALAGFDWLFVDMEHGAIDLAAVERIVQAVDARCPCVVRVPVNDRMWIGKVLDIGVSGIIIPQVTSADETARAVRAAKYPPEGERGVGGGRAFGYSLDGEYLRSANERAAVIVQIEHVRAVEQIEEIAAVPGVDALMIGPNDLAASMGYLGDLEADVVRQAIAHVRSVGAAHGLPMSIYVSDVDGARRALEEGFTFVPVGTDNRLFARAAQAMVRAVKE